MPLNITWSSNNFPEPNPDKAFYILFVFFLCTHWIFNLILKTVLMAKNKSPPLLINILDYSL